MPWIATPGMQRFFRQDAWNGAYASERERYERVLLERRANHRQGHKLRPTPATPDARRSELHGRYRDFPGAVKAPSPLSPPRASDARAASEPAPAHAPKSVERRMSLQEMARQMTGRKR